ncbi:MAG: pilus assembly protein TadG-related protein [Hyphomicrobiaceae bacterium]
MSAWIKRFAHNDHGTISILFGLSIMLVVLTVGIAIDSARAYNISTRISAALDASALAAAKMLDDENFTDADVEDRAQRFFSAHFSSTPITGVSVVGPNVQINRNKGEVDVAVEVKVETTFAQLAGIPSFNYPRSTKVTYHEKQIELAMVLDITGSMCQPCSKIDGLKSAARTLVANIITPETPAGYVRVALAPYSAAVNADVYAATVSGGLSRDGCVVERTGINNDTDAAPVGPDTLGVSSSRANRNYYCPPSKITPLTADTAKLNTEQRPEDRRLYGRPHWPGLGLVSDLPCVAEHLAGRQQAQGQQRQGHQGRLAHDRRRVQHQLYPRLGLQFDQSGHSQQLAGTGRSPVLAHEG